MKTKAQKAGRLPAKPQTPSANAHARPLVGIRLTFSGELADQMRPLTPAQRDELIERGVRLMLRKRTDDSEGVWFKQKADQIERVFHHALKPSLSIGRDPLTGRWLKLEPASDQPERELTLPRRCGSWLSASC